MSDTQKTDAAAFSEGNVPGGVVTADFARELERENIEQARLLGMSAERELALRAKLEAEVEEWKVEYWREKAISTKLEEQNLKLLQDSLERDVLVDRLAEIEAQKPYVWEYRVNGAHVAYSDRIPPEDAYDAGTLVPLYTRAAQPPSDSRMHEAEMLVAEALHELPEPVSSAWACRAIPFLNGLASPPNEHQALLSRCVEAVEDLFNREVVERDGYVGYQSRWDRYNRLVVETGELLADLRAAVTKPAATQDDLAARDLQIYGTSYVRIEADGTRTRIDPATVMIAPQPETDPPASFDANGSPVDAWPKCSACGKPIYLNHECVGVRPAHETDGRREGKSPLTADNLAARIAGAPPVIECDHTWIGGPGWDALHCSKCPATKRLPLSEESSR